MDLPIIVKLRDIQKAKGLSDGEMAQQLHVSRQLYQMTRSGEIPPGKKILSGISVAFPELHDDVIYFLSDGDKKLSTIAKNPSKPPPEAQGRGLKRFCVGLLARLAKTLKI